MPAFEESNRLVEEYYQKGFAKWLKIMNVDIDDQIARHMPVAMANEIKQLFEEKLGIKYDILEKERLKNITKIIKRGKIKNRVDYELVINRIDEIYADPSMADELQKLNALISTLEKDDKTPY